MVNNRYANSNDPATSLEEIEQCEFLMTIPSNRLQPSLNLAHAVLITAYELSKAEYAAGGGLEPSAWSLYP